MSGKPVGPYRKVKQSKNYFLDFLVLVDGTDRCLEMSAPTYQHGGTYLSTRRHLPINTALSPPKGKDYFYEMEETNSLTAMMHSENTEWRKKREHLKNPTKIEEIKEKNLLTEIEPLQLAF